jgi:hypothetical protein
MDARPLCTIAETVTQQLINGFLLKNELQSQLSKPLA